ncbi:hypothetical protein ACFL3V_02345 [Nanoarchaeota archaeon]
MADSFWEENVNKPQVEQKQDRLRDIGERILSFWYVPLVLIVLILISDMFLFVLSMALMVGIAVLASFYRKFTRYDVGFELVSFFSITTSFAVHPIAGALVAAASILSIDYIHKRKRRFRNARAVVYAGLCLLVGFFEPAGVVMTGVILVMLRKVIFAVMTFFHDAEQLTSSLPRILVNIGVNIWLFFKLGEWMVGVLG